VKKNAKKKRIERSVAPDVKNEVTPVNPASKPASKTHKWVLPSAIAASVVLIAVILVLALRSETAVIYPSHGGVIINQVYGRGQHTEGSVSRSFVELYNLSGYAVDLNEFSLIYSPDGPGRQALSLAGQTIAPRSSFLIVNPVPPEVDNPPRYIISSYDIEWQGFSISNRSFTIELMYGDYLVDFVAAYNSAVDRISTGAPVARISAQRAVRRVNFSNTGINARDFESLDYRESGIDDSTLQSVRPRYSGDGAWGFDIIPGHRELMFLSGEQPVEGGIFFESFYLTLYTAFENSEIWFTTDGSEPRPGSGTSIMFTDAIHIDDRTNDPNVLSMIDTIYYAGNRSFTPPDNNVYKGNTLRVRVFSALYQEPLTEIYTRSFFVNPDFGNLPIISLVTDYRNFFDRDIGIYVRGTARNMRNMNFRQRGREWERPVHVEMFEPDGSRVVAQDMGVRVHGGHSRTRPYRSLRLYARNEYGNRVVNHDIFQGTALTSDGDTLTTFRRLILRSAGNDGGGNTAPQGMMRDMLVHSFAVGTNTDYQAYRQSVVFLNGEFWGVYNIRERPDRHMVYYTYEIDDADRIDVLRDLRPAQLTGDDPGIVAFNEMMDWFSATSSLAGQEEYEKAQTFLDIYNFIDYIIIRTFSNTHDWPNRNEITWRYRTDFPADNSVPLSAMDGRWRRILNDADHSFGFPAGRVVETSPFERLGTNPNSNVSRKFRRLITNADFVEKFVNRYADLMNTNMSNEAIQNTINYFESNIAQAMTHHVLRWHNSIDSYDIWRERVDSIRVFAELREPIVRDAIRERFDLQNDVTITLTVVGGGTVEINNMSVIAPWTGTYFAGFEQQVLATPADGYSFAGWYIGGNRLSGETEHIFVLDSDMVLEAHFVRG